MCQLKSTVLILVTCLIATVGGACGSQTAAGQPNGDPCVVAIRGSESRIQPENSGLPCSSIKSILSILPNAPGVYPLDNNQGEPMWVCREYPRNALPREIRCRHGQRHFEQVQKSAS